MRITAALCWYDEPTESLERVIASVAPLVDRVVAFDGAWEGFPCGDPMSGRAQHDAIEDAARRHGIDLRSGPRLAQPWPSQAAKRTTLYRAASEDADWILVIDADEELRCDDTAALRDRLHRLTLAHRPDVVNVRVATPGIGRGGGDTATAPGGVRWQPRILRADASMMVGPRSHRTLATDTRLIQCENDADRGHHAGKPSGRAVTIQGASIINRTHSRSAARIAAKASYGKARAERGID